VLVTLEFIGAGIGKFGDGTAKFGAGWFKEWAGWGLPLWSLPVVGTIELGGAFLLLVPRFALAGAAMLIVTMIGAMTVHAAHGEWSRIVLNVILCALATF